MREGFAAPPRTAADDGAPRRVGVELELGGLGVDAAAAVVAAQGLVVEPCGRYERRLVGDPAGPWTVEVDSSVLKRMGRQARDPATLAGGAGMGAEAAVALVVEAVMPVEVITPPLPLARLPELEALVTRLRAAGARGSTDRLIHAFGMQLNPEAPRTDAAGISAVLKAFLCLHDWLAARARVDLSRRLTTFVDPFPRDFVQLVVDPTYRPDLARLIDDYLHWNPTRNRALDLLPLFVHLDEARVRAAVKDPRVTGRPAYHYRLPNSEVGRRGWRIAPSWNDWVEVERLAADPARLVACGAAYGEHLSRSRLGRWLGDWAGEVERTWLGR